MRYIFLFVLWVISFSSFCQLPKSPKTWWLDKVEMTWEDQEKIIPGIGYIMTWYKHDKDIDSNSVFAEVFKDSDFNKKFNKGYICFYLNGNHSWVICNCKPIDSLRKIAFDLYWRNHK